MGGIHGNPAVVAGVLQVAVQMRPVDIAGADGGGLDALAVAAHGISGAYMPQQRADGGKDLVHVPPEIKGVGSL